MYACFFGLGDKEKFWAIKKNFQIFRRYFRELSFLYPQIWIWRIFIP